MTGDDATHGRDAHDAAPSATDAAPSATDAAPSATDAAPSATDAEHVPSTPPDPADWRPFWEAFLATRPELAGREPDDVFAFGDHAALADELADLVRRGIKRATTASAQAMLLEPAPAIEPGSLCVVVTGAGTPVCVIETLEVFACRFDEVDAAFAADEGEGDRSLAAWREAHERFFRREGERLGYAFAQDMNVVCERFRMVWPAAS
jgi:uncharacterized protein YhfF